MAIIGIDLGTTYSLVGCCVDGTVRLIPNALQQFLTPSVIGADTDGTIIAGSIARQRLVTHPQETVADFKQFMGTGKTWKLGGRTVYAEDLSSLLLRQLKEDAERFLGEEVTEAVVSVPAYFDNNQRAATKAAGKLAGLHVERIVNEPSAAALQNAHAHNLDGTFLVIDLGGGTLDISVVDVFDNVVDILAVAGHNHLGGIHFDECIVREFLRRHPELTDLSEPETASLRGLAEKAKRGLTDAEETMLLFHRDGNTYSMMLTEKQLAVLTAPLLEEIKATMKKALRDSRRSIDQFQDVLLIGGSTKMPLIRKYIAYITGREPVSDENPDLAVVRGVALVSGIKARQEAFRDTVLTDICPFTLGVGVRGPDINTQLMSPIIERNSSLPISRENLYASVADNQQDIQIQIYQGEALDTQSNLLLGSLHMELPPLPAGEAQICIRFTYDINGILEIDATCLNNGCKAHTFIVQNKSLSEDEIAKRLEDMQKLKLSPGDEPVNRLLMETAKRLFMQLMGPARERLVTEMALFGEAIESKNISDVRKAQERFQRVLNQLDQFDDGLQE